MRLNVFGRRLEVVLEKGAWSVYEFGEGRKRRLSEIVIPDDYDERAAIRWLEDMFHESATPENSEIKVLE